MSDPTKVRIRIIDPEHPHYRESGYLTGKIITVVGKTMAEMTLENCRHGTDGCFVAAGQTVVDLPDPQPVRRRRR